MASLSSNPAARPRPRINAPSQSFGGLVGTKIWPGAPSCYYRVTSYSDPKMGVRDGIKLSWRGPIFIAESTVVSGSTTAWGFYNTLLANSSVGPTTPAQFAISPDQVLPRNSPASLAYSYNKFMFKKLSFDWLGTVASGVSAGGVFGLNPDGATQQIDVDTLTEIVQQPYSTTFPLWGSSKFDVSDYLNQKDLYYTDSDTTTDASLRQSYQGFAALYPSGSVAIQTVQVYWGILYSEGEVILTEPQTFKQDYVFSATSKSARPSRGGQVRRLPEKLEQKEEVLEPRPVADEKKLSEPSPGLVDADDNVSKMLDDALSSLEPPERLRRLRKIVVDMKDKIRSQ